MTACTPPCGQPARSAATSPTRRASIPASPSALWLDGDAAGLDRGPGNFDELGERTGSLERPCRTVRHVDRLHAGRIVEAEGRGLSQLLQGLGVVGQADIALARADLAIELEG